MGGQTPDQQVTTTATKDQNRSLSVGDTSATGTTSGTTSGTQFGSTTGGTSVAIPDWLKPLITQATGTAGTALSGAQDLATGYQIPPETLAALRSTAGGDFLYGGPQQQAFVDAAVRGAAPGVFSQFGAAGGGGGGLQKAALNRAAVDAYAGLFNQERDRQLNAATGLAGVSQLPFSMEQQLAQLAGGTAGQFSPFLGQNTFGTSFGTTSGQTSGTSQQTGTSRQESKSSGTGTSTQTQPIYQTPWWQTALGAGAAGLGLLASPVSGAANAPTFGGSLLGLFR